MFSSTAHSARTVSVHKEVSAWLHRLYANHTSAAAGAWDGRAASHGQRTFRLTANTSAKHHLQFFCQRRLKQEGAELPFLLLVDTAPS